MLPPTPADLLRLGFRTSVMLAEAQMVITLRMLGMMGLWRVTPGENARMVSEKHKALQSAGLAATRAALAGKPATTIAEQALQPVRRRTRANVTRLARRGPGKP